MGSGRSVVSGGKSLWRELSSDDVGDFAAGLSYRLFLALFPFFIFITALGAFIAQLAGIDNPSDRVLERFGDALPSDARSILETQLTGVLGEQKPGLLSVGLIGTVWAASGAMGALMKATNRMYDVEETRPFWKRTGIALGLTLLGGLFFIGAFALAIAGQFVGSAAVDTVGLGGGTAMGVMVLGYAGALVLLMMAMAFLYWAAPDARLPFKWVSPGAVLFALGWVAATAAFGLYVANFGSYNATYGALGGVVILLVWFYLTSYILLAGAELNAMLAQRTAPEEAEVPAAEPGRWQGPVERSEDPDEAARAASGGNGVGGQAGLRADRRQEADTGAARPGPRGQTVREGGGRRDSDVEAVGAARGLTAVAVVGVAVWRAVAARRDRETQSGH
jgi:membrane protein